ncbi:hypothetical protein ABIB56_001170 [Glaciihabitans sp. UYNi722]
MVCEAISAGMPLPALAREALPTLPSIMAKSDDVASRLDHGSIDAVEAAILRDRVGEIFEATVISASSKGGVIQLADPAVTANCEGSLEPGAVVRATLVTADVATRTLNFRVRPPSRSPLNISFSGGFSYQARSAGSSRPPPPQPPEKRVAQVVRLPRAALYSGASRKNAQCFLGGHARWEEAHLSRG